MNARLHRIRLLAASIFITCQVFPARGDENSRTTPTAPEHAQPAAGRCVQWLRIDDAKFPPAVVPEGFGVNFHYTKGPEQDPQDVAAIADSGFRFVREDMRWEIVEAVRGQYDFSPYDLHRDLLSQAGLRPLYVLQYSNLLYEHNLRSVRTPEGRKAFAAFAAAAAGRYAGQGVVWEIWNEPNNAGFWPPEPSAEEYFALVVETVNAMRKADPKALIVAPATNLDFQFLEALLEKNLLRYVDGISLHPYRFLNPPETVATDYDRLRELFARYTPAGRQVVLVSSEWGYSSVTSDLRGAEDLQARYLPRQFLVNLWQRVPLQIWFDWRRPDGEPPTPKWAIVTPDRQPTKALRAGRTMMRLLTGYRFLRRVPGQSEEEYYLLFSNCRQYAVAAWLAAPGVNLGAPRLRRVVLRLRAGRGEIVSMLGGRQVVAWDDSGLELMLSEEPQYIILDSIFPTGQAPFLPPVE